MTRYNLAIIIPCFNEYERLEVSEFSTFLNNNPETSVCFVNDASKDLTINKLTALKSAFPKQVDIIENQDNLGKAASVRNGVLACFKSDLAKYDAYLDADLAVSLEECQSFLNHLVGKKEFVFASRILKIGSTVERRFSRFLIGRIVATFISNILNIKVYDTQCGCKVFKHDLVDILFAEPFVSKWLFDVELFSRMLCTYGKKEALCKMDEIPVKRWIDKGESKVKLSYMFRLWYDLFLIRNKHKKNYHF